MITIPDEATFTEWILTADAVFRDELKRPPALHLDPAGLVSMIQIASNGGHVEDMVAAVRASAEWKALHAPRPVPAVTQRRGIVRAERRVFVDDDGPYLGVGASLFWAGWGAANDLPRLEKNLAWLKAQRVDYIRAIAVVGPTGWSDRTMPAGDVEQTISHTTEVARAHGLRVAWSLFGNVDKAPTPADRERTVRLAAAQIAARADAVQYCEVGNEAWQTGFAGAAGIAELRQLARILRDTIPNLVSLTSPQTDQDISALYDGSPATLMGVHPDRNITGQGGIWRPVRQCWDYRDSRVPWVIDEPIGHKSTVAEDFDPLRQAMAAANGWLTGAAGYVVHAGAGIRGGGREDLDKGREANWFDVPGAAAVFAAINTMRDLLPRDLPNFDHHNAGWATYPFESSLLTQPAGSSLADRNGYLRAFAATAPDGRLVCLPMLAREPLPFQARRPMHLGIHEPLTGALLDQCDLRAGETFTLSPRDAAVLIGR
jgi:hypothetical protein